MPDPLAAFDEAVLEAAAAEAEIDPDALGELLCRQQRLVRDFPDMTVEALVHDWRAVFPDDPLVATDDVAYYLSVREPVWRDLLDRMDVSDTEGSAMRTANARQFRAAIDEDADRVAVVLTK